MKPLLSILVSLFCAADLFAQAAGYSLVAPSGAGFNGAFSSLTDKPTTLSGYGITDGQPIDADLTSIAALSTTSFGRGLLTSADAAGARSTIGAGTSSFDGVFASLTSKPTTLSGYGITDGQPIDSDLTSIAALSTTSSGRSLLTASGLTGAGLGLTNGATIDSWGAKTVPAGTVVGTTDTQTLSNKSIPATQLTGGLPVATLAAKAIDATVAAPLIIYLKNVTVRTSGSPADLSSISIPTGYTRFKLSGNAGSYMYAETASGTLAGATFNVFDGSGGTGNTLLSASANGPASAGALVTWGATGASASTASTIYIRQLLDSANAGTISFYITLYPLL